MAIRTKDEILTMIRERIGDDTSDSAIAIMEDVTDTLDDYETRIADSGDWKARYEQNDAEWRTKYIERFSGKTVENIDEEKNDLEEDVKVKTFEELFTEEKE